MLDQLSVVGFRNIERADFSPGPQLNFILGDNGAGKSSLLEAVDFLSRGRTFRTRATRALLREGDQALMVSAVLESGRRLGVRRTGGAEAAAEIRIDGEAARTQSEMAAVLPVMVFHAGAAQQARSETRYWRGVLDWGVFHVKPAFREAWKTYQQALRQRNALLQRPPGAVEQGAIEQWNRQMAQQGEILDACRREYAEKLIAQIKTAAAEKGDPLDIRYFRGWPEGDDLEQALGADEPGDRRIGYTRRGPHRATLRLLWEGTRASERASRGQMKTLSAMVMLAQVRLFAESNRQGCVVMVDDLTSEFDEDHSRRLLEDLERSGQQIFVTATEMTPGMSGFDGARRFHIQRGKIEPTPEVSRET